MNINITLFAQMIAFGVFVVFCMRYVWPPITKALDERTAKIAEGLAAAERGQQEQELGEQRALEVMREAKGNASDIITQAQKRYNDILDEAKRDVGDALGRDMEMASGVAFVPTLEAAIEAVADADIGM